MAEEKKMFLCVKSGRWNIKITPQTSAGFKAFCLWMLLLLLPTMLFIPFAVHMDGTPQEALVLWGVVPVIFMSLFVCFAMVRWMKARADTIDIAEWKREKNMERRRGRRP